MNALSEQQLTNISGGVHWFPNKSGGFSAPGSQALTSIAQGNGGDVPSKITHEGVLVLGSVIGGSLGTLFGPVGGVMGMMLGRGMAIMDPAIRDAASQKTS